MFVGRLSSFICFFILLGAALGRNANAYLPPEKQSSCKFPAIFNLGDSNSDTGELSAAFHWIRAPNGITYFGKPTGRPCDGLLVIDHFTQELGLSYLHPYLDSFGANFRQGTNFAASGSTIQHFNSTLLDGAVTPFSLDYQLAQFIQFHARSVECHQEGCACKDQVPEPSVFSQALYTIDIGQNDLAFSFYKLPVDQVRQTIPGILVPLSSAIQSLYQEGARNFWIHNTGPIGCLPVYVIYGLFTHIGPFDKYGCAETPNEIAQEFNHKLKELVTELRSTLPLAAITYVDVYSAKYKLISDATELGFVDPIQYCCGRGDKVIVRVGCGEKAIVNGTEVFGSACEDPLKYVSWDGIHYSHAANQLIAKQIINGSLSDPPIPLSAACRGS